MAAGLLDVWIPAARPKTLAAAVAPVLMGVGIAVHLDVLHVGAALLALAGAVAIQIGTNFANDYFDAQKGADTDARLGPRRATATGQVAPATMKRAFFLAFLVALACGALLVARAGWPVVVIGVLAITFGILYTGGPAPLAYTGTADPVVLVFFGPVAVAGTVFVQSLDLSIPAALAGLGPGLIAVALLTVNNLRDIETDRPAGKRTLAVRFGRRFAKTQYVVCLVGAAVIPVVLWLTSQAPLLQLMAVAPCVYALVPAREVVRAQPGDRLAGALGGTGRLLFAYGVLSTLGWAFG